MKPAKPLKLCLLILFCIALNASSQSISGIVNSYYHVTAINTASNTVTVSNSSGLTAKTRVLLIQMKGATINSSASSSYGNITAINNAGNYEMNTICSVSGNDLVLQFQMLNSYTPADTVQLLTVPSYNDVTITDSIKSSPWSPSTATGGIVAIEASNSITLNSGIDVSGQGFNGGSLFNYSSAAGYNCDLFHTTNAYFYPSPPTDAYNNGGTKGEGIADYIANEQCAKGKLANGGGGGNNQNTGGGGGGNYASGGVGGTSNVSCYASSPGIGGIGLSAYGYSVANNRIFLGGGGGSGHENNGVGLPGGNGGGIVLLSAPNIVTSGMSILANGGRPYNAALTDPYQASGDGAGGGGAGGTVIINGTISGTLNISANGADGGNASYPFSAKCTGPGGGGGGGAIWVTGSSFPAAITSSVTGGQNGVQSPANSATCGGYSSGAAAGSNGNAQPNYVLPVSTTQVCTPLPIPGLRYFTGRLTNDGAILSWVMNNINEVYSYQLQSSVDHNSYNAIATIKNSGELNLSYTDSKMIEGTVYYRLMMTKTDGSVYYSEIVPLTRNINGSIQFISLRPNPAVDNLAIVLYSKKISHADILVYNSYGQKISVLSNQLAVGYNKINLPVSSFSSGAYYLKITGSDFSSVKSFIKR
ncbi:MAG TPA: T9SS type A sorting domain-containing protein [Puia sp.]|nr:T9SS type A sorting domain-containing protein [Puia sp.]